ncbi:phospho-acceptor domain-containing protein [Nitrosospira sp. Nsp2]|uniref:sensor histidine kinase n=1 Tax=Nitrosospira sp. Nsp2 TaxID=136548 RepID=UPI000D45C437|nr:HAMP domain-containing sensor histidine kinase [Nitrosospira sp. Nsp2]PTR16097.1 phospho-acceptor domain-containing protein [Nitrosospira sp. Nsp2]
MVTLSTDQNLDPGKLSANGRRMLALKEEVLAEWTKRLRQTVKEAERLAQPILINTFPALYDNLAQAISPGYPRVTANEGNTVASEHGSERARLTNYNAYSVISEYQQLRWTIFDVLKLNGIELDESEVFVVHTSIDGSIRESVNGFALAQAALRQRFIAALTHDLRNPLSNAHAYAQLIERTTDPLKTKEFARKILDSLNQMDGMIQELLDSAALHSGERPRLHLEEFDLQEVIKEVCDQLTAEHGCRFQFMGNTVTVWWDRSAIRRALENMVGNALKYGTPDTPIRVNIALVIERTILSVHNEGEPIPPDEMESIFHVFIRAEAAKEGNKEGWGIGLPYVRSVAESHGGSVTVDSAAARGTTFIMDMPQDARPFQDAPILGEAWHVEAARSARS